MLRSENASIRICSYTQYNALSNHFESLCETTINVILLYSDVQCRIYAYILCRNLNIWVKAQHQKTYKNMERDKRKSNLKTHHLIFISLTAFWYLFLLILT